MYNNEDEADRCKVDGCPLRHAIEVARIQGLLENEIDFPLSFWGRRKRLRTIRNRLMKLASKIQNEANKQKEN